MLSYSLIMFCSSLKSMTLPTCVVYTSNFAEFHGYIIVGVGGGATKKPGHEGKHGLEQWTGLTTHRGTRADGTKQLSLSSMLLFPLRH